MPYLGFLDRDEKTYQHTKDVMLSKGNPYFAAGPGFTGAGSVSSPRTRNRTDDAVDLT